MPELPGHDEVGQMPGTRFLQGDGEMAARIWQFDWTTTTLGRIENWPQSLKIATGIVVHSRVPIVMLWGNDGYMIYNDAYSVFAGAAHPRLLGSKVADGWPEAAVFNQHVLETCLAGGTLKYRNEELLLDRDGRLEPVWLDLDYSPVMDESGRPAGVIAIVAETTERVLSERRNAEARDTLEIEVAARTDELKANQRRLRTIFETSFGFQGFVSIDGVLLDANGTSLEAIASRLDDVVGKPFAETPWFSNTPGMAEIVRESISQVRAGGVMRREVMLNLPVGGWRWYDFAMRPMRDDNGKVIAILPEAIETTERRAVEEALRQSQKLEAMGQLTGGVAHDFNNLLTPILGSLDMLHRQRVGTERQQRLIDGGLQSAERAKTLVQRLLAFARRQPLQPRPVDVASLISDMRGLILSTTGPRIRVDFDLAEGLPAATAEANQLEMALLNLAVNARDAMPEGGVCTISAQFDDIGITGQLGLRPGGYIRIHVEDTGIGMDAATVARAIEPFFSTKGVGKGTGLGLSMVHGLASQLGGAIDIVSHPGKGTRIELWLPVSTACVDTGEVTGQEGTDGSAVMGTALLVDDDVLVRAATADMLTEMGYHVVEVESAEQALGMVHSAEIELVVTDHLMPGMTGTELAAAIRVERPSLPVLLISGFSEVEGVMPDLPRLTKPFRSSDLAATLATLAV